MAYYPEYPEDLPSFLMYETQLDYSSDALLTTRMQDGLERTRKKFEVEPIYATLSFIGTVSEVYAFQQWRKQALKTVNWFKAPVQLPKPSAGFEPADELYFVHITGELPQPTRISKTRYKITFKVILLDIGSDLEIELGDYPEYILFADVLDCAVNLRLPKYE